MEMESHEEKLHKMIIPMKINDTKDVMKRKAMEIDKIKVEKKMERGGGGSGGFGGGGISGFQERFRSVRVIRRPIWQRRWWFWRRYGQHRAGGEAAQSRLGRHTANREVPKASPQKLGRRKDGLGSKQKTNRFMDALRQEGESVETEYTKGRRRTRKSRKSQNPSASSSRRS